MNSYYEKMLATREVKCIDEEIPFEIPQGWEWCRLGEISTYAQTKRKINASNADSQLWGLDLEDIEKGGRLLNIKTVGERKAIGDKTIFNRGDILYSKLRPYLLKILVAPEEGICTPEIIPFTCYGNICKDYIVSFLKSPYVDDYINSVTFGVKMPRVSTETMTSLLVPLPPLSEQFRIDTKTKELMPYIDGYGKAQNKLNKLNEELSNTIRKSILQEAIQGKLVPQIAEEGTAKDLLEQIKAEKQKLVKEGKLKKSALASSVIFRGDDNKYYELIDDSRVCIDEFLPFQIPETWVWCKVKDLLEIQTGASFKKEQANANKKGIRILRGGNILPNKYIFKDDDVFVSEEFVNANTILKKNCIITPAVTSLENIGKMAVIEKDYNNVSAGGFVFIISPYIQDFNHSLVLAYFLQSPFLIEAMRGITKKSGAAFYNLGKERLKELYLPLPPMAEQRRIVDKINEVLSSIMSR